MVGSLYKASGEILGPLRPELAKGAKGFAEKQTTEWQFGFGLCLELVKGAKGVIQTSSEP